MHYDLRSFRAIRRLVFLAFHIYLHRQPLKHGQFVCHFQILWNLNTLVNINELGVQDGNSEVAVIQRLEHAGTQVLQYLPAGAQQKLGKFLEGLDLAQFTTASANCGLIVLDTGTSSFTAVRGQLVATLCPTFFPHDLRKPIFPDTNSLRPAIGSEAADVKNS